MTLQDYKRLVESFLKSLKTPEQRIKNLMKECVSDIQGAYKKNWDVKSIEIPMSMNLLWNPQPKKCVRKRNKRGKYGVFNDDGLEGCNPRSQRKMVKQYLRDNFLGKKCKIVTKPDGTIYNVYDIQDNAKAKKKSQAYPRRGPVLEVNPLKCGVRVSLTSILM